MKKVVLAYSGGLDTSYCAKYLSADQGFEVHAVSVNTGGFTDEEIKHIEEKAYSLGVESYKNINAVTLSSFTDELILHSTAIHSPLVVSYCQRINTVVIVISRKYNES